MSKYYPGKLSYSANCDSKSVVLQAKGLLSWKMVKARSTGLSNLYVLKAQVCLKLICGVHDIDSKFISYLERVNGTCRENFAYHLMVEQN